jgi:hypothetical protein
MDMDDGTLKRKTLIAIATMGGGCALFLTVLGFGSWMVSRAGAPSPAARDTAIETPLDIAPSPRAPSPSSPAARESSSRKPSKSEI